MYISPKSIYIRHLGKLYLYLIGTKSVPAIFLTFRQVIHVGKYTFRQVSLYIGHEIIAPLSPLPPKPKDKT